MSSGAGLNRDHPSPVDPASSLTWTSQPLEHDLDVVGDMELQLDAISTAPDTAWIAVLQEVDSSGAAIEVTAGYLRASLREVDESDSRLGAPKIPCRRFQAVPTGERVKYRIPLVANARRFRSGHRIQLVITSDDQNPAAPSMMNFRHASVGTSSLNAIASSSRLILPVLSAS
jgi:predicted acyl esterase